MSLKSVPGCLVSIEPRVIGVPVAETPGLVPQAEVAVVPVPPEADAELDVAGALEEAPVEAGDVALDELELELQPATTPIATTATAAAAVRVRQWKGLFMCSAFSWLTAS
jgi:hypothetical protein